MYNDSSVINDESHLAGTVTSLYHWRIQGANPAMHPHLKCP